MFLRLLLLFSLVPLIELFLLIKVGTLIGPWATVLLVIGTGVLGATLARVQGLRALNRVQAELQAGHMPGEALVDGLLILAAGLVLLTPGILTDLAGFALLTPPGRAAARRALGVLFRRMRVEGGATVITVNGWKHEP